MSTYASRYGIKDLDQYNLKRRNSVELVNFSEWHGILVNSQYVYPGVAQMCQPSSTDIYKRNDINVIVDYIKEQCGDHFCIVNLHERSYDFSRFDNKVLFCPCPDHCAPTLKYFEETSKAMLDVRAKDESVHFFIHCNAGRGRSGMVLAAFQAYCNAVDNVMEAVDRVNEVRSPEHMAITIPSQLRFLRYFDGIRKCGWPKHRKIVVSRIEFLPEVRNDLEYTLFSGIPFESDEGERIKLTGNVIETAQELESEFCLRLYPAGVENDCLRMQLHTDFLTSDFEAVEVLEDGTYKATFKKHEIEGPHHRKTGKNFPDDFHVCIMFS